MPIDYTKRPGSGRPEPQPQPPSQAGGAAAPGAAGVSLSKITLTKSAPSVSLTKSGSAGGRLRVNLNWNPRPAGSGGGGGFLKRLAGAGAGSVDLDLGCLWEFSDGRKGVVQALGNAFTASDPSGQPVVWLDGDDRSGGNAAGENLHVDLARSALIRRVLVFAFIYQGVPNWAAADGVVTLYPASGPQVEVRLDEPDQRSPMCAIALLENRGGDIVVHREVRYVQGGQDVLDKAYGWGMDWRPGRK